LTLTHELGHLVLHREVEPNEATQSVWEKQAYRFGSAFLMPATSFTPDIARIVELMRVVPVNRRTSFLLDSICLLKDKWHVSAAAMIHRCGDLFLLSEYDLKRLWIRYSQLGWRNEKIGEPMDNVIPSEPPEMVRAGMLELLTEDYLSAEDIETNLFFSLNDIEEFATLPKGQLSVGRAPKIRFKRKDSNVRVENLNGTKILHV
jgi:Zn-dependent peptidase ImmA (M78 family)